MECFIEFWRPIVTFGFCGMLAFLVAEVRPNHVDLYKWSEHTSRLPLQVICSNH